MVSPKWYHLQCWLCKVSSLLVLIYIIISIEYVLVSVPKYVTQRNSNKLGNNFVLQTNIKGLWMGLRVQMHDYASRLCRRYRYKGGQVQICLKGLRTPFSIWNKLKSPCNLVQMAQFISHWKIISDRSTFDPSSTVLSIIPVTTLFRYTQMYFVHILHSNCYQNNLIYPQIAMFLFVCLFVLVITTLASP